MTPQEGTAPMTGSEAADPNLRHLLTRAATVEQRIRHAVELRRSTDPDPDDDFRGLYLTDESVTRLLDEEGARAFPAVPPIDEGGAASRLDGLAKEFGLTPSIRRSCSSRSYRIWTTGSRRSTPTSTTT